MVKYLDGFLTRHPTDTRDVSDNSNNVEANLIVFVRRTLDRQVGGLIFMADALIPTALSFYSNAQVKFKDHPNKYPCRSQTADGFAGWRFSLLTRNIISMLINMG